jgi:hypothetical protein
MDANMALATGLLAGVALGVAAMYLSVRRAGRTTMTLGRSALAYVMVAGAGALAAFATAYAVRSLTSSHIVTTASLLPPLVVATLVEIVVAARLTGAKGNVLLLSLLAAQLIVPNAVAATIVFPRLTHASLVIAQTAAARALDQIYKAVAFGPGTERGTLPEAVPSLPEIEYSRFRGESLGYLPVSARQAGITHPLQLDDMKEEYPCLWSRQTIGGVIPVAYCRFRVELVTPEALAVQLDAAIKDIRQRADGR